MRTALGLGCALLAASVAQAQDTPICTDRPAKGNAPCTVPAGKWQIEASAVDWLRQELGGSETETLLLGSSTVKLGLSASSDVEVALTPFVHVNADGNHLSGIGDVTVRFKLRLTEAGSALQVAAIPFIKVPIAKRGIGNSEVEGGLAVPVSFALAGPVSATLGPEVDLLADADRNGSHPAIAQLINLSWPVAPRLTFIGDLWANWNFDPAGTIWQASADLAVAYAVTKDLQVDAGFNAGLTPDTPDLELYAGISKRF